MIENLKEDDLAPSTCKYEEIKIDILDVNIGIKKKEKKVYINLGLQYI